MHTRIHIHIHYTAREREELRHLTYHNSLYFYSLLILKMRLAGHVARMVEGRGVYKVLVGTPEGKRPLGRPRRRWDDNTKDRSSGSEVWEYGLNRAGSG
jgi:hypothetical protein